jgi:plasmid stabilization system protein ParE
MNVRWTENAVRHEAIHNYIAQNSARYAQGMVDRITRRSEMPGRFPQLGAMVPEFEDQSIREVMERSYRIIYRIQNDRVEVLAVVHGARRLSSHMLR